METTDLPANEISFVVTYDGPGIVRGQMDPHALGPALLALAEFVDASASLTYGAGYTVSTRISANFRRGSFAFLVLAQTPDQIPAGLGLLHAFTSKEFFEVLGLTGGGGLIALIRMLRGKKPLEVVPTGGDRVRVTAQNGETTIVHAQTVHLYQNSTVRATIEGVVAPLKEEGITQFRSGEENGPESVVEDPEVSFFEPPPPAGETLQDKVSTEIIQVISLNFQEGRKWHFRMPDQSTFNSPLDSNFATRVLRHEVVFGAGDALEVELRTIVTRDDTGRIRAEREITKVIRLIPAPKLQLPFVFESPGVALDEPRRNLQLPPGDK
jgi:hypothetical protein